MCFVHIMPLILSGAGSNSSSSSNTSGRVVVIPHSNYNELFFKLTYNVYIYIFVAIIFR